MKHLFYGSLRRGSEGSKGEKTYNYGRFSGQEFIKTIKLDGYQMYNLGTYPAVTKGKGTITVELQEVDESSAQRIRWMELGAGYTAVKIPVDNEEATMYIYEENLDGRYPQIKSGNWLEG